MDVLETCRTNREEAGDGRAERFNRRGEEKVRGSVAAHWSQWMYFLHWKAKTHTPSVQLSCSPSGRLLSHRPACQRAWRLMTVSLCYCYREGCINLSPVPPSIISRRWLTASGLEVPVDRSRFVSLLMKMSGVFTCVFVYKRKSCWQRDASNTIAGFPQPLTHWSYFVCDFFHTLQIKLSFLVARIKRLLFFENVLLHYHYIRGIKEE